MEHSEAGARAAGRGDARPRRLASMTHREHNPLVLTYKATYMQRIADAVRAGYTNYCSGSVQIKNAAAFVRHFNDLYLVHLGPDARYERRKLGLGNALLLLWRGIDPMRIEWILLVTQGSHPAHRLEVLKDARKHNVTLTRYELVRITRKQPERRPDGTKYTPGDRPPRGVKLTKTGKEVLSWRLTHEYLADWSKAITKANNKRNDKVLKQLWWQLHRMPGFGPIRDATKKLVAQFRAEWRMKHHRDDKFEDAFKHIRIGWVQRLKSEGLPLAAYVKQCEEWQTEQAQLALELETQASAGEELDETLLADDEEGADGDAPPAPAETSAPNRAGHGPVEDEALVRRCP